jgi:hypothetical protein
MGLVPHPPGLESLIITILHSTNHWGYNINDAWEWFIPWSAASLRVLAVTGQWVRSWIVILCLKLRWFQSQWELFGHYTAPRSWMLYAWCACAYVTHLQLLTLKTYDFNQILFIHLDQAEEFLPDDILAHSFNCFWFGGSDVYMNLV